MSGRQRRCHSASAAILVALVVPLSALSALSASAAAPVEESVGAVPAARTAVPPPMDDVFEEPAPARTESSERARVFHQLQVLAEEVQALRGAVEEQQHRLDLLAREQQERYLGLDRRISALQSGVPTAAPPPRPVARDPQPVDTLPRTGRTEADAYRNAYAMIERGESDAGATALESLIEEFPNGQYTPNAFYWLGQLHRRAGQLEQARQMLVQVITLYPDHNKAPDALYNLGVVYAELGDSARARMYLGRVQQQHPDSTAAGLARTYAANLP